MRTATPLFPILGAAAFLMAGCSNPHAAVQSDLSGACSGQGVAEAAAYSGGGFHPVVLLASSGESHAWSDDLPEEWYPGAVEAAQLVACVGEEDEREIEVCLYNGPSITRFQYQVSLRLVEARTGAQVASTVLEGSMPRECRQSEDYDLTRLEGNHVAFAAARDWMRAHVEMANLSAGTAPEPAVEAPVSPAVEPAARQNTQPSIEVSAFCGYFGESPVTIETGQPVLLYWKWGAASDAYLQDYIDAASFELQLDGDLLDLSSASQSVNSCDAGRCVTWRLPPMTLERGVHDVVMTVTLDREITDGLDLDNNRALDLYGPSEWEAPACEILVE